MGFYFRVAPGVRVRASTRGVRVGVGPRAARLHVGTGRPGVSTGVGPVGFYSSLSPGRSRSRSASGRATGTTRRSAHSGPTPRQLERAAQASELTEQFGELIGLHQQEFPSVQRPLAPPPAAPDAAAIARHYRRHALKGISLFKRRQRAAARATAAQWTEHEVARQAAGAAGEHSAAQADLDAHWERLLANDPELVSSTLAEAFADNDAPAAPVAVVDDTAFVVVLIPGLEAVPERMPSTTVAGNLSLAKITKRKRNDFYMLLVCGYVLATVRETFAVGPGIGSVHAAVVRQPSGLAPSRLECVFAGRLERTRLETADWNLNAAQVMNSACDDKLFVTKGAAQNLEPIPLDDEPELADLIEHVDFDV